MSTPRAANAEPIPGYRLVAPLGAGGFGEVWKCVAPGGLPKAIKFVSGPRGAADKELRALALLKSITHPYLLSIERVERLPGGDLAIVSELAECSLHDVLARHRAAGRAGAPRDEALAYLGEAAEVLDLMNHGHGLQHLDIKPRNLLLVHHHVKVGDFGLVASLADLFEQPEKGLAGVTPGYAAPEVFHGRPTPFTDQYSLAVTYHELLTGSVVFPAANARAQAYLVSTAAPDLSALPESDRPAVGRALSKEPRDRFPSSAEFVEALRAAAPPASGRLRARSTSIELAAVEVTPGGRPPAATAVVRKPPSVKAPAAAAEAGVALPGLQLHECLQRGRHGEWWRATGPRGEGRTVRFLDGEPAARLAAFDHPAVAALQVLPAGPGRLALVSDAGEQTLAARLRDAQARGQPGLDRADALARLGAAAAALDELHAMYGHQHLLLSPRHLAVTAGRITLLEYGLAELCWLPRGLPPAELNPRYAAPELLQGEVSPASDQYSLALIYAELVLGLHPFRHLNARQLLTARGRAEPDLSLLPTPERAPLLKALSASPQRRFAGCAELFDALREEAPSPSPEVFPLPAPSDAGQARLDELVGLAARGHEVRGGGALYYRIAPSHSAEHRGQARLAPGMAELKLAGFREQWKAEVMRFGPTGGAFYVRARTSLWQRWAGQSPGLYVEVALGPPRGDLTPIRVTLAPAGCSGARAADLLAELGPNVLASLQTYLGTQSARAEQERFPLDAEVFVVAGATGTQMSGRLRDIGRDGLAVFMHQPLMAGPVTVTLTVPGTVDTVRLSGRVRDSRPCEGEGAPAAFEVEVALRG